MIQYGRSAIEIHTFLSLYSAILVCSILTQYTGHPAYMSTKPVHNMTFSELSTSVWSQLPAKSVSTKDLRPQDLLGLNLLKGSKMVVDSRQKLKALHSEVGFLIVIINLSKIIFHFSDQKYCCLYPLVPLTLWFIPASIIFSHA